MGRRSKEIEIGDCDESTSGAVSIIGRVANFSPNLFEGTSSSPMSLPATGVLDRPRKRSSSGKDSSANFEKVREERSLRFFISNMPGSSLTPF